MACWESHRKLQAVRAALAESTARTVGLAACLGESVSESSRFPREGTSNTLPAGRGSGCTAAGPRRERDLQRQPVLGRVSLSPTAPGTPAASAALCRLLLRISSQWAMEGAQSPSGTETERVAWAWHTASGRCSRSSCQRPLPVSPLRTELQLSALGPRPSAPTPSPSPSSGAVCPALKILFRPLPSTFV